MADCSQERYIILGFSIRVSIEIWSKCDLGAGNGDKAAGKIFQGEYGRWICSWISLEDENRFVTNVFSFLDGLTIIFRKYA